jgi:spoIIIJ-associated protein
MEWVETTGRTVDEALDAALDQLGVAEDEAEYEVLEAPRGGLLGRREARIRARVRPLSREKPGERRGRPRRPAPARSRKGARAGRDEGRRDSGQPPTSEPAAVAVADEDPGRSGGGGRGRRRGGRGRGRSRAEGNGAGTTVEDSVSEASVPVEEQAEVARSFAQGLVEAFGADGEVEIVVDAEEDHLLVDITGSDLGYLVGPKGATVQAIEELVRTVVQRQTEGHGARLNVDVGGYRAKRREALERFAGDLAGKVKESGREQALEPMSPADRKVVHDAVAPLDGVSTISEGEEPRRRVVVRPD